MPSEKRHLINMSRENRSWNRILGIREGLLIFRKPMRETHTHTDRQIILTHREKNPKFTNYPNYSKSATTPIILWGWNKTINN